MRVHARWNPVVAGLGAVLCALALAVALQPAHADDPLTLVVTPSAPSYSISDSAFGVFLDLQLNLDNSALSAVRVTQHPYGSIRVKRVTRNGVVVKPFTRIVNFDQGPASVQLEKLTTLPPGGSVAIPFNVQIDEGIGVLINSVRLGRNKHKSRVYPLSGAATYTVQLTYQLRRPAGQAPLPSGPPDVVRRKILSNVASFTLTP
jgi:hypothetical protein